MSRRSTSESQYMVVRKVDGATEEQWPYTDIEFAGNGFCTAFRDLLPEDRKTRIQLYALTSGPMGKRLMATANRVHNAYIGTVCKFSGEWSTIEERDVLKAISRTFKFDRVMIYQKEQYR